MHGANPQWSGRRFQETVANYRWWIVSFVSLLLLFSILFLSQRLRPEYDLIVSGATVFDGHKLSSMPLDVGTRDGRVVTIGHLTFARGKQRISGWHQIGRASCRERV